MCSRSAAGCRDQQRPTVGRFGGGSRRLRLVGTPGSAQHARRPRPSSAMARALGPPAPAGRAQAHARLRLRSRAKARPRVCRNLQRGQTAIRWRVTGAFVSERAGINLGRGVLVPPRILVDLVPGANARGRVQRLDTAGASSSRPRMRVPTLYLLAEQIRHGAALRRAAAEPRNAAAHVDCGCPCVQRLDASCTGRAVRNVCRRREATPGLARSEHRQCAPENPASSSRPTVGSSMRPRAGGGKPVSGFHRPQSLT